MSDFIHSLFGGPRHDPFLTFNREDGYLEAVVRGFRSTILDQSDYANLCQCETLEDMKIHLSQGDYAEFLQNEGGTVTPAMFKECCTAKMVNDFRYLRSMSADPLSKFLDFITYGYMIDNIILLITGTLHERDTSELLQRCHPLGMFKTIATLGACRTVSDLYQSVLIDTPLGPYISNFVSEEHFGEENVEVIRNTLYRAYLRDFYNFCLYQGGATEEIMKEILEFEADRRSITITINSFGTELSMDDRAKLFPDFGHLYPAGTAGLAKATDVEHVRDSVNFVSQYRRLFADFSGGSASSSDKSLEDTFFEYEVQLNKLAFETQMGYGVFYAYFKLKEQEIRNIVWIAECIAQGQKAQIHQGLIPIF